METPNFLGEYLLKNGKIDEKTLHNAMRQQEVSHESLGNILVATGFISQKDKIMALREVDVDQLADEATIITRCPPKLLIETQTMILVEDREEVFLATRQNKEDVEDRLKSYYPNCEFVWNPVDIEKLDDYLNQIRAISRTNVDRLEWLLRESLARGASDIHIEPRESSYTVFMRVDGVRRHVFEGHLDEYSKVRNQVKERSGMDSANIYVPHDGGFSAKHHGRNVDFRVATTPSIGGEKIVIRVLNPENTEVDLKHLDISRLSEWTKGVSENNGICLICGPTGSGKTTTLNATIRNMDRFGKSICSIEDPVEYKISYVTQINVNKASGLDFARGLKALMRMDPDVIVVGEIRDIETAEIAIKAAETGHLVIGTLHTGSIGGALERLRDIGVDPHDIKNLVRSIMVQRLVRKACDNCHGEGCDHCDGEGEKGRSMISEVKYFENSEEVMAANDNQITWPTMMDDLIVKHDRGEILRKEIIGIGPTAQRALEKYEEGKS